MQSYRGKFSDNERKVADIVADEILTIKDDKEERRTFFLVLLLLICLIFLVSSLSFSVFDTYYNGGDGNSIDVGVDIGPDNDTDDNGGDKPSGSDSSSSGSAASSDPSGNDESTGGSNKPGENNDVPQNHNPGINPSSVFFNFNEGSNYINMIDVLPTSDEVGKNLTGDKQYFDFNISANLNRSKDLTYEISIIPVGNITMPLDKVRVYLTEDDNPVSVNSTSVSSYSELPNSKFNSGKVIYKKKIDKDTFKNYVFRMWLSHDAKITGTKQTFACKISVNAYQ